MRRAHRFIPSAGGPLERRMVLSHVTLGLSTVTSGLAPHLQVLNRKQTALVAEVNQAFTSFQDDFDQARATYFASIQANPSASGSSDPAATSSSAATSTTVQAAAAALVSAATASSSSPTTSAIVNAANALVSAAAASASASSGAASSTVSAPAFDAATTAFLEYTQQRTLLLAQQLVSSFVQTPQGLARASGQPNALKQLIDSRVIGPKGKGPAGSLIQSLDQSIQQMSGAMLTSSPTTTLYTLGQDNAIQAAQTAVLNGVSIIKNGDFGIKKPQQI